MKNLIKEFFKKRDGVFAIQLFANEKLTLSEFDEQHLIMRMKICGLWKPEPILFRADPFLFEKDEELYLFYEKQSGFNHGQILMIKTADLVSWTEPVVVLKEPFHLSFPFVFEEQGKIYMIPESQEDLSIRLYEANNDLTSFTYIRTLLKQEIRMGADTNCVDNYIYKKDGIFYLFTSFRDNWTINQELFYSNNLLNGEFIRHKCSPICISNEYGRNGGSLLNYYGHILRVSQDCANDYGSDIDLHEIIAIDKNRYEEKLYKRKLFSNNHLFPDGGHQLNIVYFKNQYIYATDYREKRWTWYHLYYLLKKKIKMQSKRQ